MSHHWSLTGAALEIGVRAGEAAGEGLGLAGGVATGSAPFARAYAAAEAAQHGAVACRILAAAMLSRLNRRRGCARAVGRCFWPLRGRLGCCASAPTCDAVCPCQRVEEMKVPEAGKSCWQRIFAIAQDVARRSGRPSGRRGSGARRFSRSGSAAPARPPSRRAGGRRARVVGHHRRMKSR